MFIREVFSVASRLADQLSEMKSRGVKADDPVFLNLMQRFNLAIKVKNYTEGLSWVKQKLASEKVSLFIKYGCSMERLAEQLGVDYSNKKELNKLQASMSHAASQLKKYIGDSILDDLQDMNANVERLEYAFSLRTGNFECSALFLPTVLEKLPDKEVDTSIGFVDCFDEMRNLRHYTMWFLLQKVFPVMDEDKLSYLRRVIFSTDATYAKERGVLYKFLVGELNSKEDVSLAYQGEG